MASRGVGSAGGGSRDQPMQHRPARHPVRTGSPRGGIVPYSRRMQMEMAHSGVYTASGTLVIFTRVDGLLRQRAVAPASGDSAPAHRDSTPCELSRNALSALISTRAPLVFVSDSDAPDVRQIQHELGLMQPFISSGGSLCTSRPSISTNWTMCRRPPTSGKCSASTPSGPPRDAAARCALPRPRAR